MEIWLLKTSTGTCDHHGGSAYCNLSHALKQAGIKLMDQFWTRKSIKHPPVEIAVKLVCLSGRGKKRVKRLPCYLKYAITAKPAEMGACTVFISAVA